MKPLTLIVFSLLIFPRSLLAQIITPNSTVEECIAYIEQIANKNKLSTDESIKFAGTFYVVLHSPLHKTAYIGINWASFSTLKVDASHEYMSPSVTFVFTDSLVREVEMANRNHIVFRDFHTIESFRISASKEEIPGLEIAAKRLAQLAKTGDRVLSPGDDIFFGIRLVYNNAEIKEMITRQINGFRNAHYAGLNLGFELLPNYEHGKFKMNTQWNERTKEPEGFVEIPYKDLVDVHADGRVIHFQGTTNSIKFALAEHVPEDDITDLIENLHHWLWLQGFDRFEYKFRY